MNGGCPSRLGDGAAWCDTHGGVTAVCTVCDARALIVSWTNPVGGWALDDSRPLALDGWLIGAHPIFDYAAAEVGGAGQWHPFDCGALYGDKPHWHPASDLAGTR